MARHLVHGKTLISSKIIHMSSMKDMALGSECMVRVSQFNLLNMSRFEVDFLFRAAFTFSIEECIHSSNKKFEEPFNTWRPPPSSRLN